VLEGLGGRGGDLAHGGADLGHEAMGPAIVEAHQDAAGGVVVGVTAVVQVVAVFRRQPVLNAGDRPGPVARPHLLDAQRQHGPVLGDGRHGGQVE
jgi:hypothetical protein